METSNVLIDKCRTLKDRIDVVKKWRPETMAVNIGWINHYLKPIIDELCELEKQATEQ